MIVGALLPQGQFGGSDYPTELVWKCFTCGRVYQINQMSGEIKETFEVFTIKRWR